jgi:germination protein M
MKKILLLILALFLVTGILGCSANEQNEGEDINITPVEEENAEELTEQEESVVTLYFGNEEGYLRKEMRTIKGVPTAERGKELIQELISGTLSDDDTLNVLPEGTQILDYSFDEEKGLATVDFSEHILGAAGSMGEIFAVYSVVNTLTELPGVEKVQFLVEGEIIETIAGHIYTGEPLERDLSLLEGNELK